jgi:aryl-alcohol dehydrogenase
MTLSMQAAVSREGVDVPRLEAVELEEPRADEALIRIVACGICHTDAKVHRRPGPKPIVLGHEGAGVVQRVGSAVRDLAVGDHVVLGANFCGRCATCRRGETPYCAEAMPRNFGGSRPDGTTPISQDGVPVHGRFFGQSSFAQYALVDALQAVPVPADLPLTTLAPLGCGVVTGAGSVLCELRVGPGQSLVVFGAGAVGLSAIMAAALAGASQIIAVDLVGSRLEVARELGATAILHPADGDVVEAIRELTRGGADFSFNTTPAAAVYEQAIACLGLRGVAGYVAPAEEPWTPNLLEMMAGGRSLRGIIGGTGTPRMLVPLLIDELRRGRFPLERLIRTYDFAGIADAFHDAERGETIKPVLTIG